MGTENQRDLEEAALCFLVQCPRTLAKGVEPENKAVRTPPAGSEIRGAEETREEEVAERMRGVDLTGQLVGLNEHYGGQPLAEPTLTALGLRALPALSNNSRGRETAQKGQDLLSFHLIKNRNCFPINYNCVCSIYLPLCSLSLSLTSPPLFLSLINRKTLEGTKYILIILIILAFHCLI